VVEHEQEGAFAHAIRYQGVWASTFRRAMEETPIENRSDYVFLDLGCGRGKALLLASAYGFKRVVGVELSARLVTEARVNVASFRPRGDLRSPIEVICADAATFEPPTEPALIYLHNPFDDTILRAVLNRLRASLAAAPRPALLLYHTPVHSGVLDRADFLMRLRSIRGGLLYSSTL
jgi:SAM-dependent methyltransferase